MIDDIRQAVNAAASSNDRIAMFHFQVLKNAKQLEKLNAKEFCRQVGVPVTYGTEFTKMIGLARLMEENGVRLTS